MNSALIGYTGFVGGNLNLQTKFTHLFNSKNIGEISNNEYEIVVCAAPTAVKWHANQFPEEDLKIINKLKDDIKNVKTNMFVYISTVDVYKNPINVDENTIVDDNDPELHPYGKHRRYLEKFVESNFQNYLIIRLPGLFGVGLKKNFIFDLMTRNALDYTHKDSKFQFYYLKNIWRDINTAIENNIKIMNFATEPVDAMTVAEKCFNEEFSNITERPAVDYNMKTINFESFNGENGYMYSQNDVIKQISEFLKLSK